jgi:subtilisin family serine protease
MAMHPRSIPLAATALALLVALSAAWTAPRAAVAGDVGPGLARLATFAPDVPVAMWVNFSDRAGAERDPAAFARARFNLAPRALARRLNRAHGVELLASDLPVHAPYVRALTARGATLRGTSRWRNAASVTALPALGIALARLPFVQSVELVPLARRSVDPGPAVEEPGVGSAALAAPQLPGAAAPPAGVQFAPGDTGFYGPTFKQLQLMQVPAVHKTGNTGQGVLVCMLDGGFRTTHAVYQGLQIVAQRDFVHGDSVVDDQVPPDSVGDASHGTFTTSEVAGLLPGVFAGGAFGCAVALGKTENVPSETPVEMDYWQMGAEWADSLGADVISSSLGYFQFDSPFPSYVYADMDGRTTVVTQAAVEAARRGITVVNANGNEGATAWHFLIAPADADSIISCGAVDSFNVVTSFSSRGPTADGRIKPDVTGMGRAVVAPSFTSPTAYVRVSGTSLSTPLIAGAAALVLSAHPTWGPFEVREALRETALNHASPDNNIGWGLVQVPAAIAWVPSTTGVTPGGHAAVALSAAPNPFRAGPGTAIRLAPHAAATLDAFDARGRRVARVYAGAASTPEIVRWSGTGLSGQRLPAGLYWLRLSARTPAGPATPAASVRVVLLP